jgi:TatD DNase family protein
MPDLIDSHAHLDFADFDADRDAVLARAREAGVTTILAIGSAAGPDKLDAALPFAEQHSWIYASVGVHPHEARLATQRHLQEAEALAGHVRVIAWGEIGLDYHYDHSPREVQQRIFREQLTIARRVRKPVIIHCREAWADCLAILEQDWASSGFGGIFHCFSGAAEDARRGLDIGFLISFAGNLTYPKSQPLRDVAAGLPLESLLIETDSPFLAPQGFRGKRNEPAYVQVVARTLATVRHLPDDELAARTSANFRALFRLRGPDGKVAEAGAPGAGGRHPAFDRT